MTLHRHPAWRQPVVQRSRFTITWQTVGVLVIAGFFEANVITATDGGVFAVNWVLGLATLAFAASLPLRWHTGRADRRAREQREAELAAPWG